MGRGEGGEAEGGGAAVCSADPRAWDLTSAASKLTRLSWPAWTCGGLSSFGHHRSR